MLLELLQAQSLGSASPHKLGVATFPPIYQLKRHILVRNREERSLNVVTLGRGANKEAQWLPKLIFGVLI